MPAGGEIEAVRIRAPQDVRRAAEALRDLAGERFDCRVGVHHDNTANRQMRDAEGAVLAIAVFGWTDAPGERWWRQPRLALTSPFPALCRYESEPFWCNAHGVHAPHPNTLLEAVDLRDFEARAFATAAIVAPVHLPFGQIGAACFVPRDPQHTDLSAEFAEHGDALGLLARTFVAGYQRVMGGRERLPANAGLSKREVQCLQWAALGKTDLEIGLILERSRGTVRFHIHSAATKLDAVNRSQAVLKAAQLGYIGLGG